MKNQRGQPPPIAEYIHGERELLIATCGAGTAEHSAPAGGMSRSLGAGAFASGAQGWSWGVGMDTISALPSSTPRYRPRE